MAKKNLDHEIRARIDAFLGELSGLVKQAALESVHDALGDRAKPRRGPGRPRKPGRRRAGRPRRSSKRIRRSPAELERIAKRVLAHVKSNAGQRLEQIGKAIRTDTGILKRPIAQLLAAKKLKTAGRKRGTKYFAR